jgi:anthranilate phosphoribosyltransferase
MINQLTAKLQAGQNLLVEEMNSAMDELLSETASDSAKADFLMYLTKKGETDDELYAMLTKIDAYVQSAREHSSMYAELGGTSCRHSTYQPLPPL